MTTHPEDEQTFPSTTYEWRKVKIKRPAGGKDTARAKRGPWTRLATWPRHRKLRLTVSHRGGAASWWLIETRGASGVVPGNLAFEDVMKFVLNEPEWDRR